MPEADAPYKEERLAEIARMADLLADRVLNAQIMGLPVKKSNVLALLEAFLLLNERGHETPMLLAQVIRRLDAAKAADVDNAPDEEERQNTQRLARSLRPLQVVSVNEVEIRGGLGAAIGQAACGGITVRVSSSRLGVKPAMPSICM